MRAASTALLCLAAACSHSQDGPGAQLTSVMPELTCGAQHSTKIALGGNGFAPLIAPVLGSSTLQLPAVMLKRGKDLSGQPASDSLTIPDDASHPETADEQWVSEQSLSFQLCPPDTCSKAANPLTDLPPIPTGLYDVTVTGSSGAPSTLPASLGIVGPPTLTHADPDIVCEDVAANLSLTGDFLYRVGGTRAGRVELGMAAGVTAPAFDLLLDNCRPLPAPADQQLEACTHATFGVPPALIRSTTVGLFIVNPTPVDCRLEQDPMMPTTSLTFVRSPALTAAMPTKVCPTAVDKQVMLTGAGFLQINGLKPQISVGTTVIGADQLGGCTTIVAPGLREGVVICTQLTFTIKAGQLAPKTYTVTVTNPAPASCVTPASVMLTIGSGTC